MKFFVMMLVSSSLMLSSCKDDDDDDDDDTPKPSYTNVLTAKVGGASFSASSILGQMYMGGMQISGTNVVGLMQIIVPSDIKVGTYPITSGSDESVNWATNKEGYSPGTGTIVVVKHDETGNIIEGTFKANLKELSTDAPLEITDGVFKVNYIEQ